MLVSLRRPLVVIDGSPQESSPLLALLGAAGWSIYHGFRLTTNDWLVGGVVCCGSVTSPTDAALAVLSAVRGAGLVVTVPGKEEVLDRLVEDLSRIGPVDLWPREEDDLHASLSLEQWCLLDLLASGRTLSEAARVLHWSRRTADRKLAAAKEALGTATTAEAAVAVESRLPWSVALAAQLSGA